MCAGSDPALSTGISPLSRLAGPSYQDELTDSSERALFHRVSCPSDLSIVTILALTPPRPRFLPVSAQHEPLHARVVSRRSHDRGSVNSSFRICIDVRHRPGACRPRRQTPGEKGRNRAQYVVSMTQHVIRLRHAMTPGELIPPGAITVISITHPYPATQKSEKPPVLDSPGRRWRSRCSLTLSVPGR